MFTWLKRRISRLSGEQAAIALLASFFLAIVLTDKLGSPWPMAAYVCLLIAVALAGILIVAFRTPRALAGIVQLPLHAVILRRAARALGWRVSRWRFPREAQGFVGGIPLRVRLSRPHLGAPGAPARIVVDGLPEGITIEMEGVGTLVSKAFGDRDIVTGDPEFDRRFYVKGETRKVLSALDAGTRQALLRLAGRWRLWLGEGRLQIETRRATSSTERYLEAVREAVALVTHTAWRRRADDGLAENARHDPIPAVRLESLKMLAAEAHWHAALADPSVLVRARAALRLGREGRRTLLQVVGDPTLDAECAAEAVRALGSALPEARGIEILQDALRLNRGPVIRAVVENLRINGTAAAVAPLNAAIEAHPLDYSLRREVHETIDRIQASLKGAEAGQVSIADEPANAGQLSLSNGPSGQVSLDEPVPEQRSASSARATESE